MTSEKLPGAPLPRYGKVPKNAPGAPQCHYPLEKVTSVSLIQGIELSLAGRLRFLVCTGSMRCALFALVFEPCLADADFYGACAYDDFLEVRSLTHTPIVYRGSRDFKVCGFYDTVFSRLRREISRRFSPFSGFRNPVPVFLNVVRCVVHLREYEGVLRMRP